VLHRIKRTNTVAKVEAAIETVLAWKGRPVAGELSILHTSVAAAAVATIVSGTEDGTGFRGLGIKAPCPVRQHYRGVLLLQQHFQLTQELTVPWKERSHIMDVGVVVVMDPGQAIISVGSTLGLHSAEGSDEALPFRSGHVTNFLAGLDSTAAAVLCRRGGD
jgi:hypothetical protein